MEKSNEILQGKKEKQFVEEEDVIVPVTENREVESEINFEEMFGLLVENVSLSQNHENSGTLESEKTTSTEGQCQEEDSKPGSNLLKENTKNNEHQNAIEEDFELRQPDSAKVDVIVNPPQKELSEEDRIIPSEFTSQEAESGIDFDELFPSVQNESDNKKDHEFQNEDFENAGQNDTFRNDIVIEIRNSNKPSLTCSTNLFLNLQDSKHVSNGDVRTVSVLKTPTQTSVNFVISVSPVEKDFESKEADMDDNCSETQAQQPQTIFVSPKKINDEDEISVEKNSTPVKGDSVDEQMIDENNQNAQQVSEEHLHTFEGQGNFDNWVLVNFTNKEVQDFIDFTKFKKKFIDDDLSEQKKECKVM